MPEVSRTTFGFSQMVTPLNPCFFAYSKAAVTDAARCCSRDDAHADRQIGPGNAGEGLEFRMRMQRGAHISGGFVHSTPAYMPFGALAEHDYVSILRLVEAAVGALANEVQRIAGETEMQGRMQISRLNFCRMVTIGL